MRDIMKVFGMFLLLGLWVSACSSFPPIRSLDTGPKSRLAARMCQNSFPEKPFRAVHTIEATMPMGNSSSMMGASQVNPEARSLRAVLVSVEGLTLFDATSVKGVMEVHRAVAPFDDPDFARGLMSDVSLVFMAPDGKLHVGIGDDGRLVCRYKDTDGGVVDLLPTAADSKPRELLVYDKDADLVRIVDFFDESGPMGLAKKVVLSAPGLVGYELVMKLVGAEKAAPVTHVAK